MSDRLTQTARVYRDRHRLRLAERLGFGVHGIVHVAEDNFPFLEEPHLFAAVFGTRVERVPTKGRFMERQFDSAAGCAPGLRTTRRWYVVMLHGVVPLRHF